METPEKGGAVRRSDSGRLLTDLTRTGVRERMSKADVARFLGTMSGGGQAHTVSRWWVPGFGRRDLIVERKALAAAIGRMVPAMKGEAVEPEPAQAALF